MYRIDSWGDLSWYFGCSLGAAAQSYEGHGGAVFDDFASHMTHIRKRLPEHRRDVNRHTRIGTRIASMSADDQRSLHLGFSPWGSDSRACYGFLSAMTRRGACLAGLVLRSHAAAEAFRETHDTDAEVPESIVMQWLDSMAKRTNGGNVLRRLADVAERELVACVGRYEGGDIRERLLEPLGAA
jgi:hypothetical protein